MSLDPLLPIAPARVKALLLPVGKIKADRFASFVERLQSENVVYLRDITADSRPNRNMFSPLAYPDGVILYDLISHAPPPSHLALSPFDLYREPLVIIAIADGSELGDATFSKRHSSNGTGLTATERNLRALYQELEDLRDVYPKSLVHQVLVFDYVPLSGEINIPEDLTTIPTPANSKRTTMKSVMCNISSLLLAEMTTLAKSVEAMTSIDSPGSYAAKNMRVNDDWSNGAPRRNSHLPQHLIRSSSAMSDRGQSRMSMPPVPTRTMSVSSGSTPRPETPTQRERRDSSVPSVDGTESGPTSSPSSPEPKIPMARSGDGSRDPSRDRVSVQGFGPGGANDRWRLRGKGRAGVVIGSMYLQAGRWSDALRELSEGAQVARSLNDHIWHGKALELILMNLFLLGWLNLEFQIPIVCLPIQDRPASQKVEELVDPTQPKHLRNLQLLLPELLDRILSLYSRISSESLPPLPFSETTIRFCKILSSLHGCNGILNQECLNMIVVGTTPKVYLTTSPRLIITPSRQQIVNTLFKAFPSSATELLTTADRVQILSGIAAVLGQIGYHRKKAMVTRELVSVLIGGLVEARTKGAAEAGVHPAAGLIPLGANGERGRGATVLDLGEADVEQGIEAFLDLLCRSYGVVSFDPLGKTADIPDVKEDLDAAVISRIERQLATRFFGFAEIKLNILRSCINFAEALPDFNGVLKFSSDLMRTAGSGVAPALQKEHSPPLIFKEEQVRLAANISRTWALAQRLGMTYLDAEYWDEFLVRGVELEPLPLTRTPVPHARSILPGATASRASQDVNPFIYNPFLKEAAESAAKNLVAGEIANFKVTLQNTYDIEVEIESIRLEATGVEFEALPTHVALGPYRTQTLIVQGRPKAPGTVVIKGAMVRVRGCRERLFPIFTNSWTPQRADKVKSKGLASLDIGPPVPIKGRSTDQQLSADTFSVNVVQAQPLIVIKSTTLSQSSVMVLEGERHVFSVTLQNLSENPVDFMLFSFTDSTQGPLQTALNSRDVSAAEMYEYELILMKKQALRLPKSEPNRHIVPGGEATFDFEILGKPGLTNATIQVDYTYLGVPIDEITEQFFTRQLSLDLAVTVNASVELSRIDTLPIHGGIPQSLLDRVGGNASPDDEEYCLLSMDMRNSWPSQMTIRLEGSDGMTAEDSILPGKTTRLVLPIKRMLLEDPHASIPSLNPNKTRQFVVSSSKISPDMERANREAFWYREKILDSLKATWRTASVPRKEGVIDLRNIRLTTRMIEAIKIDEVDITISMEPATGGKTGAKPTTGAGVAIIDEFMNLKVHITNKTSRPVLPMVRLVPALCHRPLTVALDYTRKIAWNGTLQQLLPELKAHKSQDFVLGFTALCRGEFEITASVEEVLVWEPGQAEKQRHSRPRSNTQEAMDAALGVTQRRMWHSRHPFQLSVKDE
ncbi:hypercellular (hypA) [Cordyceps militaris]|uniref:Hypercellular (HypA) n=1 Tax=Cordyceps militaris TaxID=73501 RepID=A0A2H4SIH9_CORMI|nr:hypercellular (hypA) [Cordyceps militaris]